MSLNQLSILLSHQKLIDTMDPTSFSRHGDDVKGQEKI